VVILAASTTPAAEPPSTTLTWAVVETIGVRRSQLLAVIPGSLLPLLQSHGRLSEESASASQWMARNLRTAWGIADGRQEQGFESGIMARAGMLQLTRSRTTLALIAPVGSGYP